MRMLLGNMCQYMDAFEGSLQTNVYYKWYSQHSGHDHLYATKDYMYFFSIFKYTYTHKGGIPE